MTLQVYHTYQGGPTSLPKWMGSGSGAFCLEHTPDILIYSIDPEEIISRVTNVMYIQELRVRWND